MKKLFFYFLFLTLPFSIFYLCNYLRELILMSYSAYIYPQSAISIDTLRLLNVFLPFMAFALLFGLFSQALQYKHERSFQITVFVALLLSVILMVGVNFFNYFPNMNMALFETLFDSQKIAGLYFGFFCLLKFKNKRVI